MRIQAARRQIVPLNPLLFVALAAISLNFTRAIPPQAQERSFLLQQQQHQQHQQQQPQPVHPAHPRNRALDQHESSLSDELVNDTQALRRKLLTNYDRRSYPFTHHWNQQTNATIRTGLPVEVGINFHRVKEVEVAKSVVDLVVWVRQRWNDPRLKWNPDEHNGVDVLHFWIGEGSGAGGEMSEIWSPDIQLWNMESPLAATLADAHAVVQSNGNVFWSRPGHIRMMCKFDGLEDFPFDTLGCTFELGSWAYSGLYLRPGKMDETGFSVGGSETAGESFAVFSLLSVECEEHLYPPFPSDPEGDWPVLFYHISFKRSWEPYTRGYLLLQIILNIVAFTVFWLPNSKEMENNARWQKVAHAIDDVARVGFPLTFTIAIAVVLAKADM